MNINSQYIDIHKKCKYRNRLVTTIFEIRKDRLLQKEDLSSLRILKKLKHREVTAAKKKLADIPTNLHAAARGKDCRKRACEIFTTAEI